MSMRAEDLKASASEAQQRWAKVGPAAAAVARHYGISVLALANACEMPNSTFRRYLAGAMPIPAWLAEALSQALGVPVEVLQLDPNDAVRWVLDHPQQAKPGNRCYRTTGDFTPYAGSERRITQAA